MNRLHQLTGLAIILLFWAMAGCAPIYLPSSPNTPMLEQEGDMKLSGKLGFSGGELHTAYAVRDQLHLFGTFMTGEDDSDLDTAIESTRHTYVEVGAGRSWRPNNWFVFEGSGGLGYGSGRGRSVFNLVDSESERLAEGNYIKPFLQANFAIQTKVVDIGFVNRLALIKFGEITDTGSNPTVISDPAGSLAYEPSLFAQFGWDRLKFSIQSTGVGLLDDNPDFDYNPLNLSFGLSYRFSTK